jgi:AbrB family looped-hinge helix DNA binding protein
MARAKVTSKGQITIPAEVRKAMRLDAGDEVEFVVAGNGRFSLKPRNGSIRDLAGCARRLDRVPTIEEMNEALLDEAAESYQASVERPEMETRRGEAA